jgi:hypothetical protein
MQLFRLSSRVLANLMTRTRSRAAGRPGGGVGEFGERLREAQLCRAFGGEFVVSAAEVLDEGVPGGDSRGRAEAFQTAHRPQPSLQPTMISFYPVVCVLLGDMRGSRDEFVQDPQGVCCGEPAGARVGR